MYLPFIASFKSNQDKLHESYYRMRTCCAPIPLCSYIFLVGMLMSQFTVTGYDSCAHLAEETVSADKSAASAILLSVGVAAVAGLAYILALLFSIQVRPESLQR